MAGQPTATAGLVLGESLYDLSSFEEAEQVLAKAVELGMGELAAGERAAGERAAGERAAGDDELVRISTVRRRNLFWGCRLDEEAIAAGRTVSSRLAAPAARAELITGAAGDVSFGWPLVVAPPALGRPDCHPPAVIVRLPIP